MTRHCSILGIPVETGAGRRGCLMGPDALRAANLPATLSDLGNQVHDLGNLAAPLDIPHLSGPDHLHNLNETVAWADHIQKAAYKIAQKNTFPIFIGGDHSMAAGTLPALTQVAAERRRPLFVLWLDAHPDLHTLHSTTSGHLHGTPMAYALGRTGFENIFPAIAHPLPADNICMMGLRSIDPPEGVLIDSLDIEVWDMRSIDENGVRGPVQTFLEKVRTANGLLHVSFDVDFLDPAIAPAVGTTVPGGASFREAHLIMEMLADSGLVSSLELTELNPYLDIRGQTADLICDLTASLMGQRVLDRPTQRNVA